MPDASPNLGLWEPTYRTCEPFAYGGDLTYRLGAEFLAGCRTIEDWGCGTQWFRRVMRGVNPAVRVLGLDGSAGHCDRVVDLVAYVPADRPDGIFLRHVLEHALAAFMQRMILILFTPFSEPERRLYEYVFPAGGTCPYIALPQSGIEESLARHGLDWRLETIPSPETEMGLETIFWITRPPSP